MAAAAEYLPFSRTSKSVRLILNHHNGRHGHHASFPGRAAGVFDRLGHLPKGSPTVPKGRGRAERQGPCRKVLPFRQE